MKITQISVFLENSKGRLFEVCTILGKNNINIRALNIAENGDFGVLRMVVDKPAEAVLVLKKGNFVANQTDIIAVEVEDRPGGLSDILQVFNDTDLNIEYMYGFIEKSADKALMVFRFDNIDKALIILKKNNIKVASQENITNL